MRGRCTCKHPPRDHVCEQPASALRPVTTSQHSTAQRSTAQHSNGQSSHSAAAWCDCCNHTAALLRWAHTSSRCAAVCRSACAPPPASVDQQLRPPQRAPPAGERTPHGARARRTRAWRRRARGAVSSCAPTAPSSWPACRSRSTRRPRAAAAAQTGCTASWRLRRRASCCAS
jgi:hypothetical protein